MDYENLNIHNNIISKLDLFLKSKKNSKYNISWALWKWKKNYYKKIY